jgi:hypothetical protein
MKQILNAAAAALSALLCARVAAAGVVVGPEMDMPFVAESNFPSLAVLDDGSFAVAGSPPFRVQAYSRTGQPLGRPVETPGTYGGVGPLGDRYFVSWQLLSAGTAPPATKGSFLSRAGQLLARPFAWPNSPIENYHQYYRYGGGPDHAFVPVLYRQAGVDQLDNPIWVPTVVEHGGNAMPVGHAAHLAMAAPDWQLGISDLAINGEGEFVVATGQCPPGDTQPGPCISGIQFFAPSGQPRSRLITDKLLPYVGADGSLTGPPILAIDPQGEVAALWETGIGTNAQTLVVRLFDLDGTLLSELPRFAELAYPDGFAIAIIRAVGNAHIALLWGDLHQNTTTIELADSRAGAAVAEPVTLGSGVIQDILFAVNRSGHGVVTWRSIDPSGLFHGHARLVSFH